MTIELHPTTITVDLKQAIDNRLISIDHLDFPIYLSKGAIIRGEIATIDKLLNDDKVLCKTDKSYRIMAVDKVYIIIKVYLEKDILEYIKIYPSLKHVTQAKLF